MKNSKMTNRKELFETILHLFFIFLIVGFCFKLMLPFIMPMIWAVILAIILHPFFNFLQRVFRGRKTLASIVITVSIIILMILPVLYFLNSVTSNFLELKRGFEDGALKISTPSEYIKNWPVIGKPLHNFLDSLSSDLQNSLLKYGEEIKDVSKVIMAGVLSSGLAFLQFLLSVVIAGVLLVSTSAKTMATKFVMRIAGNKGEEILAILVSTTYQVVKGIIGVAIIQTIIQAIGLYFAEIPYAGLLTLLCLIFSILQIGPFIINIGIIIYLFSTGNSVYAIFWTTYFIISGLSDNILKPLLLGKGAMVPMLIIFLGVIGGFIMSGFIGLFVGPIVFSIGYKLFIAWLDEEPENEPLLEEDIPLHDE
ncbi:AI-2E family transporter [Flavobacterium sp. MR2016-29]|uniref:AI-2E family transporter n=1 Tax=Flavobacterium sp. MR2016-29 TaxID=2783795 RepID=UPI00188AC9B0|nr:AI-2E family transporter [Flavobacterium sp. MR2016-29]MBF4493385.1 AI-2E family transporter [Flavobacterium sp. MR2016-29]